MPCSAKSGSSAETSSGGAEAPKAGTVIHLRPIFGPPRSGRRILRYGNDPVRKQQPRQSPAPDGSHAFGQPHGTGVSPFPCRLKGSVPANPRASRHLKSNRRGATGGVTASRASAGPATRGGGWRPVAITIPATAIRSHGGDKKHKTADTAGNPQAFSGHDPRANAACRNPAPHPYQWITCSRWITSVLQRSAGVQRVIWGFRFP